jgi:hypothetical protein
MMIAHPIKRFKERPRDWLGLMVDIVRAEPTSIDVTLNIELRDADGVSLGLILCDSKGRPAQGGIPWPIRQSGPSRTSLQIRQGDGDYSDYQLPYTPFTQKDWSGGRGADDILKRTYTDLTIITALTPGQGDIVLAGKPTSVSLVDTASEFEPIPYVDATDIINELTSGNR